MQILGFGSGASGILSAYSLMQVKVIATGFSDKIYAIISSYTCALVILDSK